MFVYEETFGGHPHLVGHLLGAEAGDDRTKGKDGGGKGKRLRGLEKAAGKVSAGEFIA